MRWAIYPACHMATALVPDWPGNVCSNAVSLNRDTRTFSIWEQEILLIRLSTKGDLKMKSDPAHPFALPLLPVRDVMSPQRLSLCDWPSSKQRCIDAGASPLAPRPVLTNALLGGFCPTGVITALSGDLLSGEGDGSV